MAEKAIVALPVGVAKVNEVYQRINNLDDQVASLLDIQRQFFSDSDQSIDCLMDSLIKEIAKLERMHKKMKFFCIKHKNGFVEWVVAKDSSQALEFAKECSGNPELYEDVKVVEEEACFGVEEYVDFYDWAATLKQPVYMGCSDDFDYFSTWQ